MSSFEISEEKILGILREYKSGKDVKSLCQDYGIDEDTLHKWQQEYGAKLEQDGSKGNQEDKTPRGGKETRIYVNDNEFSVMGDTVSYDQVIEFAKTNSQDTNMFVNVKITYVIPANMNEQKNLKKDSSAIAIDGMRFRVESLHSS